MLVSHNTDNILFSINDLASLAEQSKVLEIMMCREPRRTEIHAKVQRHEVIEQARPVFDLGFHVLE
jgi:hypothetical protein